MINDLLFKKLKRNSNQQSCIHDPSPKCKNSTLKRVSKMTMTNPQQVDYICTECHKTFRYIKDVGGTFVLLDPKE